MSQESRLVRNTAIYAVGNISSKVLSYVMVMVYSHYIIPEALGYYDVVITTISLAIPVITLELHEGVYRYLVDPDSLDAKNVIGTGLKCIVISTVLAELVLLFFTRFYSINLLGYIVFYSATSILFSSIQMTVRGLSRNRLYAIAGVLNSFIVIIFELIGIVWLHKDIDALFLAMGSANVLCVFYLLAKEKTILKSLTTRIDIHVLKKLLAFSVPLIPTTICWWVVNSCDRYIILYNLGTEFNGIYAMAAKFPTVITTLTTIFYMAWQDSALKEYNSPNRNTFFSNVFDKYFVLLFTICACCIPGIKLVIRLFLDAKYESSWTYTGPLFMASGFMALSSFLGLGYQISKQTSRSTINSIVAAGINACANILLIKFIGLHAASISTLVAYLALFIIRVWDTRKYFSIEYKWKIIIILVCCNLFLIVCTFWVESIFLLGFITLFCVFGTYYLNRALITPIIDKIRGRKQKNG